MEKQITIYIIMAFLFMSCTENKIDEAHEVTQRERSESQDTFYVAVEEMPEIIGGIESIQRRIRYPEEAKEEGIEGSVYVQAFVDTAGDVVRTVVEGDPGGGLGDAAAKAVEATEFTPGKRRGEPVPVRVTIPIHFRLAEPDRDTSIRIVEGPEELQNLISYPDAARENTIQGEVSVSVKLNEEGRVTGMHLIEGVGYGCDEAVMQAIAQYPFYQYEEYRDVDEPLEMIIKVQFSIN